MTGRRLPDDWKRSYVRDELVLERGDYGKLGDTWHVCLPNGGSGVLGPSHHVTEHEDGTITVSPSIMDNQTGFHGYLIRGEWTRHNGDPI